MANEKLISELTSFMSEKGLKNRQVETDLGLPKNSLSNFLNSKKELPKKWVEPIQKYMYIPNPVINTLGELKDKVTTANKVSVPPAKPFKEGGTMLEEMTLDAKKDEWVILVENFCNTEGITPGELIEGYKLSKSYKKAVMNKKEGNEIILQDFTKENAVGKPYDPEKNWLYKAKMAKSGKQQG